MQCGGELTVASAYVWRGEPELRTANAQPDLWLSAGPFMRLTVERMAGAIALRPFIAHVSGVREGVANRTYGGFAVGLDR